MGVPTLDDLLPTDVTVATRLDVNSPLTDDKTLADDTRINAHQDTLTELLDAGARVAILAHQGRPGGTEFASLRPHADRLDALLDTSVTFCDATFSRDARNAITSLDPGTAVVLENTRFYSEEYMEFTPSRAATTYLVERLTPVFDAYVNDAFAAAHRSQPSLVGFPHRLPGYAGRVMERELSVLSNIEDTPTPRVYVLGGAKVRDSLEVAEHVLDRGLAQTILPTGVVGTVFLAADGVDLGPATTSYLSDEVDATTMDAATALLETYRDAIELPRDIAVDRAGTRVELPVSALPAQPGEPACDVGSATISAYEPILADAGTAVVNGPAGVVENELFTDGTRALFTAATTAQYSIAGGGDTGAAIRRFDIDGFDHVSTGGGAALTLLSGDPLPAVEALT